MKFRITIEKIKKGETESRLSRDYLFDHQFDDEELGMIMRDMLNQLVDTQHPF